MRDVYQAIRHVMTDLAAVGINKSSVNQQQNYRFRGIDAVYEALAPLLSKHGLIVLPRMVKRDVTERTTPKGTVLIYVTVDAEFDFVSTADGSSHVVRTFGEAMDAGDKATSKAMSAAYKYAALMAFCVPVEGTPDADASTNEVMVNDPDGFTDWWMDLAAVADQGLKAYSAAWKASPDAFRKHAISHYGKVHESRKATAAKVAS